MKTVLNFVIITKKKKPETIVYDKFMRVIKVFILVVNIKWYPN